MLKKAGDFEIIMIRTTGASKVFMAARYSTLGYM